VLALRDRGPASAGGTAPRERVAVTV
jgi:hypothetical protein